MSQAEALDHYAQLIRKYHRTLDLMSASAVDDLGRMIDEALHYADLIESLSPAGDSIVDLGSGVGLPGIPIALCLPARRIALTERRRRRSSFLRIAVSQLGLSNATVHQGDILEMSAPCADIVVAQAVGTLADTYRLTEHLQGEMVWLVSRKGAEWGQELSELESRIGTSAAEWREEPLPLHGSLVAVFLPGGSVCPPSV